MFTRKELLTSSLYDGVEHVLWKKDLTDSELKELRKENDGVLILEQKVREILDESNFVYTSRKHKRNGSVRNFSNKNKQNKNNNI